MNLIKRLAPRRFAKGILARGLDADNRSPVGNQTADATAPAVESARIRTTITVETERFITVRFERQISRLSAESCDEITSCCEIEGVHK
jgi:hypothetical protein